MAFKRRYPVESEYASDLMVEVFVRCDTCGNSDELLAVNDVEYVHGQFYNSNSIDVHDACPVCGETKWSEKGELIHLGYQTAIETTSIPTVDSLINTYASLIAKLETARVLDFRLHSTDTGEKTMALWRDVEQIES